MKALLRLDSVDQQARSFLFANEPDDAYVRSALDYPAEALLSLGLAPAPSPITVAELHERLASTLARASNMPHSAWRNRLSIRQRPSATDGGAPWDVLATDPAALALVQRAAALVLPFVPIVKTDGSR